MKYFYHITREPYLYGSKGIAMIGLCSHRGRLGTSTNMNYGSTYLTDQVQRRTQETYRIRSLVWYVLNYAIKEHKFIINEDLNFKEKPEFYTVTGRSYKGLERNLRLSMASVNIRENPDSSAGKKFAEKVALQYAYEWTDEVVKKLKNSKKNILPIKKAPPKKLSLNDIKKINWLENLYTSRIHPLAIIGRWWALADYYAEQVICSRQTYVFMGEEEKLIEKLIGYHRMGNPYKIARPILRGKYDPKFNFVEDPQESEAFTTLRDIKPDELEISLWDNPTTESFKELKWVPLTALKHEVEEDFKMAYGKRPEVLW